MQEVRRTGYRVDGKIVQQAFDEFLTEKELDLAALKACPVPKRLIRR
ncbi:MAG: hypothetical protein PVI38_06500 [Desulfobacterales bacterium]|jgi:hypothetical protein